MANVHLIISLTVQYNVRHLVCLFGSTQTPASQLQIARPRSFQRPSLLAPWQKYLGNSVK